jgi:predicted lipoprotein with Yx(FWY)xxD motif
VRIKLVTCTIAAVLLLAACGSSSNKSSTASNSKSTTTAAASSSGSASAAMVKTSDSGLGKILTTSNGMTIYGFTKDTGGMSSCVDGCAAAWPPVKVDSMTLPSGLDSSTFKVIKRPDGSFQLEAGDWPLYTYAADSAAGQTNGQGVGGTWFVVKPDGSLNKGMASSSGGATTTSGSSSGGGNY